MSSFFIFSMDCITRFAFWGSLSPSSLPSTVGTICQDSPNLSLSQPHSSLDPPADSLSHRSSTSCCVSQFTNSEMACVQLYCGPPFRAEKSCPSSWKLQDMTDPFGPGPASP